MKKTTENNIEIYCPHCKQSNNISLEASLNDMTLSCVHCGNSIYWHNCPLCHTGYSDERAEIHCPQCSGKTQPTQIQEESFITRDCPWCREPVSILSTFLSKMQIGQCPSCFKHYEITGNLRSFSFALIYALTGVGIIEKLFRPQSLPSKIVAIVIILGGGFLILFSQLRIKKYKY